MIWFKYYYLYISFSDVYKLLLADLIKTPDIFEVFIYLIFVNQLYFSILKCVYKR